MTVSESREINMREDEYKYFIEGLALIIQRSGEKQKELAERAGVSAVNLSKVLNSKSGCSYKWREKICAALGVTQSEAIKIGIDGDTQPHVKNNQVNPTDVQKGLVALIDKFNERSDMMRLWISVFEESPVASLLIHNDTVLHQNIAAKALGIALGGTVCDNCKSEQNCFDDPCAINMAIASGAPHESYNFMGNRYYHIRATPFRQLDDLYYICTIDEITQCGDTERQLEKIRLEREFIESCPLDCPMYYADENKKIVYASKSFLNIIGVTRDKMMYSEDFISYLNAKLFSPKKITTMAEAARMSGVQSDSLAKLQDNTMLWFCFRPHIVEGKIIGVLVVVLDEETYNFKKGRGEL
jgi:transcriptional regulator with XRE-family HTH domain